MDELLKVVASWPSLLMVVVVFGLAPGLCLRLIVLAYPRDDPRRAELIAELYAMPRIQRPLWVAEQLEVALFEGLGHRLSATSHRYELALEWAGRLLPEAVREDYIEELRALLSDRHQAGESWYRRTAGLLVIVLVVVPRLAIICRRFPRKTVD